MNQKPKFFVVFFLAALFLSSLSLGGVSIARADDLVISPTPHPVTQETPSAQATVINYAVADSWQFPLDGNWSVSRNFNVWINDGTYLGYHLGQDIPRSTEAPVYAAANGYVKYSGAYGGYRYVVIIEHQLPDNTSYISLYGHLRADGLVTVNSPVNKGTIVGYLNSIDKHLHFGIREGPYTPISQTYTGCGKTTPLYRGYSCSENDVFSPSHWRKGDEFILQHSNITATCSSPSNGIPRDTNVLNSNQVTFTWTPPNCDGLDYYTFRVSNHADIDNPPWIIDHGVSKDVSSQTETIPSQYNGQTLYWAIWPHNGAGYGSRGGPWAFKIDTSIAPTPTPLPTSNWGVEYFRDKELTNKCSETTFNRTFIFQDWGEGAPASGCNADNWGARFTKRLNFQGGNYTFAVEADDWGRIYIDNVLFVNKWNGASQHYEGHYVAPGDHDVRIEFADTLGGAKMSAWWWGPGYDIPHDTQDTSQWYANYWINSTQWWDAFVNKNEGYGILNHDWGNGSPGWDMPSDGFSSKFRRRATFECGVYRFTIDHDDGAKFSLDGVVKLNRWTGAIGSTYIDLPISQGPHDLQIDHYENGGAAHLRFDWQKLSGCQPSAPALNTPTGNSSLPWNTGVSLSWYAASGATQYYATLQGGSGVNISSGWISATQWNIGGLWPGVYTWSVTARNDSGSSTSNYSRTFTIQEPPPLPVPSANFDAWPQSGDAPLDVAMHIVDTSNINSCLWNYGDGQTGTSCASSHNHIYTSAGTYTVVLSVSGDGGDDSMTRTNYITVAGSIDTENPVVNWVAPATNGEVYNVTNQTVALTVSATDNVGVSEVYFSRWDAVNLVSVDIGTVYTSPYSILLDTSVLNMGWNEIDVVAYDEAGNVSDSAYIWLYRTATPAESVKNGGFNTYTGTSKIPTYWKAVNFAVTDGKNTTRKEGTASVKIAGQAGKTKTLTQSLLLNGGGETFTFSFWSRGTSIPTTGICRAQVLFYNGTALAGSKTVNCSLGTYAWTQSKLIFTAPVAYTKIVIKFTYSKATGSIWLDLFSLKK